MQAKEAPELTPLDACLQGSLGIGDLSFVPNVGSAGSADALEPPPTPSKDSRRGGHYRGFDLHAGVVVFGSDREGRERLLRYCARPPLSLDRLSVTDGGMIAYRLQKPCSPTQTHRLMTPLQFMSRLAALVAPPRCPLIRFHGVFGPHSLWRSSVVPDTVTATEQDSAHECGHGSRPATATLQGGSVRREPKSSREATAAAVVLVAPTKAARPTEANATQNDPAGPRFSAPWRIDWATLLKRTYREDVLACPCGGRLRFVALVTEPERDGADHTEKSMGLPADAPPVAKARSPAFDPDPPPHWD
ncbi:transposase [Myxococcota bacterium]